MLNRKTIMALTVMTLSCGTASMSLAADRGVAQEMGNENIQAYSKTTEVKTMEMPLPSDLLIYDINGNGILEAEEVGERLFHQFDRDGNGVLDNIEFNRPLNLTFAPVERTRIVSIDFNNDGIVEAQKAESEVVMKRTGLDRFATRAGHDGVTPRDFIGHSVLELDLDKSGVVELSEWKRAYLDDRAPLSANNKIYNR